MKFLIKDGCVKIKKMAMGWKAVFIAFFATKAQVAILTTCEFVVVDYLAFILVLALGAVNQSVSCC